MDGLPGELARLIRAIGSITARGGLAGARRVVHWLSIRRFVIRFVQSVIAGLLLGQAISGPALAGGPTGGQVVGGSGSIHRPDANTTLIKQRSGKLAINWETFNIARHERVRFDQPSSSAAALNRIFDQNPSQIMGLLQANGRVFLINPNGLIFGQSARVHVGSLVASTLDMSVEDFMNDKYDLRAIAGKKDSFVINHGLIQAATGGSVSLIAGAVVNEGVIVADYGHVNLASGRTAALDFDGDGLIRFEVSGKVLDKVVGPDGAVLEDAVRNAGQIIAGGGQVLLQASAAKDVFSRLINQEGIIKAGRIENHGGVVRLVGLGGTTINSGDIDVSGEDDESTGGTVRLLGEHVGLMGNASIDASGPAGGGTVLVGGDFQGGNPDVPNASRTYVGPDVQITADAVEYGDGGKVIVWADEVTRYYGNISARGGANVGDGGFVEVSGKQALDFAGGVDLSAPTGTGGTLLLDPENIVLNNTTQTAPPDKGVTRLPRLAKPPVEPHRYHHCHCALDKDAHILVEYGSA